MTKSPSRLGTMREASAGLASLMLAALFSAAAMAAPQDPARSILVDKSDRTVTILHESGEREVLSGARFGAGWKKGPKRQAGDEKTPEGTYHVLEHRTSGNHRYVPALYLDYPNTADVAASRALGVSPGGDILIHGPPSAMPFGMHPPGNWTDGCIALSRRQMRRVMSASRVGTTVVITP